MKQTEESLTEWQAWVILAMLWDSRPQESIGGLFRPRAEPSDFTAGIDWSICSTVPWYVADDNYRFVPTPRWRLRDTMCARLRRYRDRDRGWRPGIRRRERATICWRMADECEAEE